MIFPCVEMRPSIKQASLWLTLSTVRGSDLYFCCIHAGHHERFRNDILATEDQGHSGLLTLRRDPVNRHRPGRSLTRDKLFELITRIILDHIEKEDRKHYRIPFTSTYLRNLFQGKRLKLQNEKLDWESSANKDDSDSRFHPFDKYSDMYSTEDPLVVISYRWDMCLLTELPYFILRFEQKIGKSNLSYWIDIFMNDQNSSDHEMKQQLDNADYFYSFATYHAVFVAHNTFSRVWINHEISTRLKSAAVRGGYTTEQLMEAVRIGADSMLPILVYDPRITDIESDLKNKSDDRFHDMEAFDMSDKTMIQAKILANFGSDNNFKKMMSDFTAAALIQYGEEQMVNRLLNLIRIFIFPGFAEFDEYGYERFMRKKVPIVLRIALGLVSAQSRPKQRAFMSLLYFLRELISLSGMYSVFLVFWCKMLSSANIAAVKSSCNGIWEYGVASILLRFFSAGLGEVFPAQCEFHIVSRLLLQGCSTYVRPIVGLASVSAFIVTELLGNQFQNILDFITCFGLISLLICDTYLTSAWASNANCYISAYGPFNDSSTSTGWGSSSYTLITIGWINVALDVCGVIIMLFLIFYKILRRMRRYRCIP